MNTFLSSSVRLSQRLFSPAASMNINAAAIVNTNINRTGHMLTQMASFSKYISKARAKRVPLNTKRVHRGYKKGYGARKEGVLDSKGRFHMEAERLTELVLPANLSTFPLKPYVGPGAKRHIISKDVDINNQQ